MAQGKKSFVLYSDQKELFEHLPDEQAGKLIKHILAYVNDEEPETDDPLVNLAFISIKSALKRDLKRWEQQREQRSKAGKKSAESRKKKPTKSNERSTVVNETERKATVNGNVSVNVNDSVNDNDIKEKKKTFNFRLSLIDLGVDKQVAEDWMKVRAKKKAANTETAFKQLKTQLGKTTKTANECIVICVENSWKGFNADWLNNLDTNNKKSAGADHVHTTTEKDWKAGF